MIPAKAFAQTARETFERYSVPFRKAGKDLNGMDSGGFIEYCLKQHGISRRFSGTNDIFRNLGTEWISLEQAIREKCVVPGAILLRVKHDDGEPLKYKKDKLGNCDFALIAISPTEGVYPSESKGKLISTKIELKDGKANTVMFCKYVDYNLSGDLNPSSQSPVKDGVYTTTVLKLRKGPSLKGDVIAKMPAHARIDLLEYGAEWCYVKYTKKPGLWFTGWCASRYLTLN